MDVLKGFATDPLQAEFAGDEPSPLRQVLINTHSPHLVGELAPEDLILVEALTQIGNGMMPIRTTSYRPVVPSRYGTSDPDPAEPTQQQLAALLEERDLGVLWVDGALGGNP